MRTRKQEGDELALGVTSVGSSLHRHEQVLEEVAEEPENEELQSNEDTAESRIALIPRPATTTDVESKYSSKVQFRAPDIIQL